MPIYPIEIIPQFLYVGKRKQAVTRHIQIELKIDAHINASSDSEIKE